MVTWPTSDAGLVLKLRQWCHQTFSVATETRSALTLCELGRGFHGRLNIWLTNIPSAVTHSAVRAFLLYPWLIAAAPHCEVHVMYEEEILCMVVEKKNHASAICLSCNLLRWPLNSVLLPEQQKEILRDSAVKQANHWNYCWTCFWPCLLSHNVFMFQHLGAVVWVLKILNDTV